MKRGSVLIWIVLLIVGLFLLIGSVFAVATFRFGAGKLAKGGSGLGGVSCAGVANVPAEYMSFVTDASTKYLDGDEAALIALIQVESSWNPHAANPNSSATGLGQFLDSTAKGYVEFTGGNDPAGRAWPPGTIHRNPTYDRHPDDARFDPERSIYAAARKLGNDIKRFGDLKEGYRRGYHTFTNPTQEAAATAATNKLMRIYNQLLAGGGCRQRGAHLASTPFSCDNKQYAFPIVHPNPSYQKTHHTYSATDIFTVENNKVVKGAALVAVTDGTITGVQQPSNPYTGKGGHTVTLLGNDGFTYYYAHLEVGSITVRKNQRVNAGQTIGRLGDTGNARGKAHLHFGISSPGNPVKGWYPAKVKDKPGTSQKSNWEVLDRWRKKECIDPRT